MITMMITTFYWMEILKSKRSPRKKESQTLIKNLATKMKRTKKIFLEMIQKLTMMLKRSQN